jgi:ABC-2 type transport system ATP-binding protein
MPPPAIVVERLTKRYEKFTAVDGISFAVPRGEFFGFLGPNGAGKSTTIRVLCGLLDAEYARIEVAGCDLRRDVLDVKARIGVMLEEPLMYERLSAREHLAFTGQMYGLPPEVAAERTEDLLRLLDLLKDADRLIVDYSQGMRKKVALGCALIHEPPCCSWTSRSTASTPSAAARSRTCCARASPPAPRSCSAAM